jgi:outer membrane biosynthesis protein TonB
MKDWIKEHPIGLAIAVSIFLHLVLLMLFGLSRQWVIIDSVAAASRESSAPIVFDLIESPSESNLRPKDAKHISDKDVSARNLTAPENLPVGEAFSAGESPRGSYATSGDNRSEATRQTAASTQKQSERLGSDGAGALSTPEFRRELLLNNSAAGAHGQPTPATQSAQIDNLRSRAPELGSFAINTYAWDYAPYLLWLKRRIEQNIYPPSAFTRMGIISGQTELRFRIYPNGRLEELHVLQTVGHKSLMETSVRAVELSVPLKPLPADFPEPYLEVTALFEYIVHGR